MATLGTRGLGESGRENEMVKALSPSLSPPQSLPPASGTQGTKCLTFIFGELVAFCMLQLP